MPMLLVTGCPASGKSTIVSRIAEDFKKRGYENISIISDQLKDSFSRDGYGDFKREKEDRNSLKSAVERLVNKDHLVICDSLNYIKGFRYELFCIAKNIETTYAVFFCNASPSTSHWLNNEGVEDNQKYSHTTIDELVKRYERPESKNRWDSPLYEVRVGNPVTVQPSTSCCDVDGDEFKMEEYSVDIQDSPDAPLDESYLPRLISLPFDSLYSHLIDGKDLKANMCTMSLAPKSSSNFLYELDKTTQSIVTALMKKQVGAIPGDKLVVLEDVKQSEKNLIRFSRQRTLAELTRLRKQFINYTKTHPVNDFSVISSLFVDFLNSSP
uniref:Protein KTI12 homolog n=1 Tax=Ditylenchus dipsaci TaxID=166011 RepID=A0A915ENL5_9BILA